MCCQPCCWASVSWARTVMLAALGFADVLLVVRPGGEMGTGMIFAVLAGTLYGSAHLAATRWLTAFYPLPFLLGSQLLIGAVLLLPAGLAPAFRQATYYGSGCL